MALWWSRYPRSASGWFTHRRHGTASPKAESRFQRWLAADPRNQVRYEQQELISSLISELERDPEIETLVRAAEDSIRTPGASSLRSSLYTRRALLAAACAGGLSIGALLVLLSSGHDPERLYATRIGEERTVVLPDHSEITLNTATRLRVVYERARRSILLEQGEATFKVAHDRSRPFEVSAAGGLARAVGTQFNVLATGKRITVAVLEGSVSVTANAREMTPTPSPAVLVTTGEQVSYADESLARPEPANLARIQGWHIGRIVFTNMALADAIAEFNRYSRVPLRLGNASLATRRITGVFRSGQTDAFLDALQEALGVRVERTNTAIILR